MILLYYYFIFVSISIFLYSFIHFYTPDLIGRLNVYIYDVDILHTYDIINVLKYLIF